MTAPPPLDALQTEWERRWPEALAAWSPYLRLSPPRWCRTVQDEKRERLQDSFAMIRLTDQAVVVSLRKIREYGLEGAAKAILAHEAGHHVYAPADLADHARLMARVRAGLPTREACAGMVANLFTDLLINDRLQRSAALDMAAIYQALKRKGGAESRLWRLYLRIYEILWSLPGGTLAGEVDASLDGDAGLGARVIRIYARDWLKGAGRFAALLLPYLLENPDYEALAKVKAPWLDTAEAGAGGDVPDGLSEVDEEEDSPVHPADDPLVTGREVDPQAESLPREGGRVKEGGAKRRRRDPAEYKDLLKSIGVEAPENELVARYYRERALPYLVRFPERRAGARVEPQLEGLDLWDLGQSPDEIDWVASMVRSPVVIPGATTLRRLYGEVEGREPQKVPLDLYVGIDCSGSMFNPASVLSYPVLAGAVVALSALRAGARVMACLSGEPGDYTQTEGFIRDPNQVLKTLTGYLGTGYAFGVSRLDETFPAGKPRLRATHLLVVTDYDFFAMLDRAADGWGVAARALTVAGGGGTCLLHLQPGAYQAEVNRLNDLGWKVWRVSTQEEMVAFAREFSRALYER